MSKSTSLSDQDLQRARQLLAELALVLSSNPRPRGTSENRRPLLVDDPRLLSVPEVCARLGLSRWSVYRLIRETKLATVKVGRRRLVRLSEVEQLLDRLSHAGDAL